MIGDALIVAVYSVGIVASVAVLGNRISPQQSATRAGDAAAKAEEAAAETLKRAQQTAEATENAKRAAGEAEKAKRAAGEAEKAKQVTAEAAEKAKRAAEEAEKTKQAAGEAAKAQQTAEAAEKAKRTAEEAAEEATKAQQTAEAAEKAKRAAEEAEEAEKAKASTKATQLNHEAPTFVPGSHQPQMVLSFVPFDGKLPDTNFARDEYYTKHTRPGDRVCLVNGANGTLSAGGGGTNAAITKVVGNHAFEAARAQPVFTPAALAVSPELRDVLTATDQVLTFGEKTYDAGTVVFVPVQGNAKGISGVYHVKGVDWKLVEAQKARLRNESVKAQIGRLRNESMSVVKAAYDAILKDFSTNGRGTVLHLSQVPGRIYEGAQATPVALSYALLDCQRPLRVNVDIDKDIYEVCKRERKTGKTMAECKKVVEKFEYDRRPERGPIKTGLGNPGNQCYRNSLFHMLMDMPRMFVSGDLPKAPPRNATPMLLKAIELVNLVNPRLHMSWKQLSDACKKPAFDVGPLIEDAKQQNDPMEVYDALCRTIEEQEKKEQEQLPIDLSHVRYKMRTLSYDVDCKDSGSVLPCGEEQMVEMYQYVPALPRDRMTLQQVLDENAGIEQRTQADYNDQVEAVKAKGNEPYDCMWRCKKTLMSGLSTYFVVKLQQLGQQPPLAVELREEDGTKGVTVEEIDDLSKPYVAMGVRTRAYVLRHVILHEGSQMRGHYISVKVGPQLVVFSDDKPVVTYDTWAKFGEEYPTFVPCVLLLERKAAAAPPGT